MALDNYTDLGYDSFLNKGPSQAPQEALTLADVSITSQPSAPNSEVGQSQTTLMGDGRTNRLVMGYYRNGFGNGKDYGFKISKDGYDVLTCPDEQLVMSSAFNMFKIIKEITGTYTINYATASQQIDITHNLGFRPMVLGSWNSPTFGQWTIPSVAFGTLSIGVRVYDNDLTIRFDRLSGTGTGTEATTYRIYLMSPTA